MSDDQVAPGRALGDRVTVVEEGLRAMGRRFDEHLIASQRTHDEQVALLRKLDERADRQDVMLARLLGGVGVAIAIGNILGPTIAKSLGLVP